MLEIPGWPGHAAGQHELRVRVTDRAGNSANSAVATTLVDNTVPTVAYTVPTDGVPGLPAEPVVLHDRPLAPSLMTIVLVQ